MARQQSDTAGFPLAGGIMLGLGLGGFVDGIVFHQILQWHHMVTSAGFPATSLSNLQFNTLLDGLFHAGTWVLTLAGLLIIWSSGERRGARPLIATLLMGFGLFNLIEGTIDHLILGIHHVNETAPRERWIYWDLGFLLWGAGMLGAGVWLYRPGR
jgi:uncharacterized membrane protein